MKRVLSFILSLSLLLMLLSVFTVAAAEIDLTGMSTEELIELRGQIDAIIGLPINGRYVTGVDIKEGYYVVTYKSTGLSYSRVSVFYTLEDAENKVSKEKRKQYVDLLEGGTATIHLTEGNVLEIANDAVIIVPVSNPSWMP